MLTLILIQQSHGLVRYSEEQTQFGDSPFWYEKTQSLYYVDFYGPNYSLLRFDYDTQKIYTAEILPDRMNAAFIIPIEDTLNEFAVGFPDRTVKRVYWNGISKYAHVIGKIFQVEQNSLYEENQWRLATIDPFGRFYGGTIRLKLCTFTSAANASFYRFDTVNGVQKLFGDVKMSNGVAFSLKKRKMYYAEGCKATVDSFDWDIPTGRLSKFIYSRRRYTLWDYFFFFLKSKSEEGAYSLYPTSCPIFALTGGEKMKIQAGPTYSQRRIELPNFC